MQACLIRQTRMHTFFNRITTSLSMRKSRYIRYMKLGHPHDAARIVGPAVHTAMKLEQPSLITKNDRASAQMQNLHRNKRKAITLLPQYAS